MGSKAIRQLLSANKRAVTINTILISNSFIWYTYALNYVKTATNTNDQLPTMALHFVGLFSALIIGESLSHKVKDNLTFLRLWMLAGTFLSMMPLITEITNSGLVIFSVIAGINFGFGIPTSLNYFASTTVSNNRGKIGGTIFFLTGLGAFLLSAIGTEGSITVSIVLTSWRAFGFLALLFAKPSQQEIIKQPQISYREIISNRVFLLYFIPWIIFVFINSMSFPINTEVFKNVDITFSTNVEFVLAGISAIIFGFFADSKGRKRLAVAGFAMLGLGYAILGFTAPNTTGWWLYTFIDGITWGIFITIFVFILWGDIGEGRDSARIYAIGIMPYLLSSLIRLSIGSYFGMYVRDQGFGTIFSFFSFFLFIAVLPLVLAPETMSEQTLRTNDLKNYVEKAKKQVQKTQKKQPEIQPIEETQDGTEDSEEYKKAKEIAEKYY